MAQCGGRPFVFVHVGDLHLVASTAGDGGRDTAVQRRERRLAEDLRAIFADIAAAAGGARHEPCIDLVYLPGDIAQNGCADEYAILEGVLGAHPELTVRLIPGDHDRQRGTMDDFGAFREGLTGRHAHPSPAIEPLPGFPTGCPPRTTMAPSCVEQFYFAETHAGVRCLFLDMVSAGHGREGFGLDFRLGAPQFRWLCGEIDAAVKEGRPVAVFAHAYPADMRNPDDTETKALAGLFWTAGVRLVEMGHTHYNELAPDGRTLYATARSVGQNEDGPVGYAVVAIDGDAVSWRFRQLQQTWPFVLVTSPADRRLATAAPNVSAAGTMPVRAVALSDRADMCRCEWSVDGGPWRPMTRQGDGCLHAADVPWCAGSRSLSVRVTDGRWPGSGDQEFVDTDTIEPAPPDFAPPQRPDAPGSDAGRIRQSWPEKGLRGDRLGPNRHGRRW